MAQVLGFIDPKDREIEELKKELMAMYELNKQLTERVKTLLDVLEVLNVEASEQV
jgi:hypothetical protein